MQINKFIKGLGVLALALALVSPSIVLAQSAITASIDSPADGAEFEVGESINFRGSASGGSEDFTYGWVWGDGTGTAGSNVNHSYNTTGAKTVTLDVQDVINPSAEDTDTITINIVDGNNVCSPLIIESGDSVPRATNITTNSATIVWETCEPATSRVVYGTAQVTDAVAEDDSSNNRGYQSSTSLNESKTTSHSVQLTGLEANTTYYFRVLSAR